MWTKNVMMINPIDCSNNGVKGVRSSVGSEASPGREMCVRQADLDRHQATVSAPTQGSKRVDNSFLRIGTCNVRALYQAGKLANVFKEMKRMSAHVLGVCETKWTNAGTLVDENFTVTYSGGQSHERGVAIITDKTTSKSIQGSWPISDRIILVKLKGKHFDINLIQVYAPTAQCQDEEIEKFYEDLESAKKQCKSQEIIIIMGDLNAKVGEGRAGKIVEDFELGVRNE